MRQQTWEDDAACAPHNLPKNAKELDWFSTKTQEKYDARAICQSQCRVRRECIEAALERRELFGIWGGVDDYELRRAMSVDANGDPLDRDRPPRCPYCLSRKIVVAGTKTRKGYLTSCANEECGLTWYMATVPARMKGKKAS